MITAERNRGQSIGVVLLAAGESKRLGRPKQSLYFKGKTLLQLSIDAAAASDAASIVVVLGANAELLQKSIAESEVNIVMNEHWQNGMASSVTCGVEALVKLNASLQALVIMVCDQPYITASLINELIVAHQNTGKPIVTCSYGDTFGPPSLFHKSLFPGLMTLTGDAGARSIIKKYIAEAEIIPFAEGITDVDTEADYLKIIQPEQ